MSEPLLLLLQESSYSIFWRLFSTEIMLKGPFWLTVIGLFYAVLLMRFAPKKQKNIRGGLLPIALYICFKLISVAFAARGNLQASDITGLAATVMICSAYINLSSIFIFDVIVPTVHLQIPRILRDTTVLVAYIITAITLLSARGVNVAALFTTSAILTAVIGLSLQDTLGNIIAGFGLQIEHIIQPGDWVKVDQHIGKVKEIRWRQTSIETRNWDLVLIPNSQMVKGQVIIYGRRHHEPLQTRRWVYFNVGFNFDPSKVIAVVNEALQSAPMENVAANPQIHCILMDFKESYCYYAVRYWLTNIAADDPTDSSVRIRIYFALKRAGIPLSLPTHNLFVTEESNKRQLRRQEQELEHRLESLKRVELLNTMKDEELRKLASQLRYAPFSRGEILTRQGAAGHWLYIITSGSAVVRVSVPAASGTPGNGTNGKTGELVEKEVARLQTGDFFGEMSLMTGESRSATVVALEDTECYRLDKEAFQSILVDRPEIAEDISHVLARRRVELDTVLIGLDAEAHKLRVNETQNHILNSIRNFFGI